MKKRTIENAKSQLKEFGFITVTFYAGRNYEHGGEILNFNTIEELQEFLMFGVRAEDDIHIPNANYFN